MGVPNVVSLATKLRSPLCLSPGSVSARLCPADAAAGVLLRRMSTGGPGQKDVADGSELDPYLPHRINYEKAKEYIKANVVKGMSREEVTEIVNRAMELHIPPVPSLEVFLVEGMYLLALALQAPRGLMKQRFPSRYARLSRAPSGSGLARGRVARPTRTKITHII